MDIKLYTFIFQGTLYNGCMDSRGFGLIEIVVVTAVVTVALFSFSQAGVLALRLLRNEKENFEATLLVQESLEAVRSVRDESWTNNINPLLNSTSYYPIVVNNKWSFVATPLGFINGKYLRYVRFDQVFRDGSDRIAPSGTLDPNTRRVSARVEWRKNITTPAAATTTTELVTYITNFLEPLGGQQEIKAIFFEDATTDSNLASFPSNNSGDGDPAQAFITIGAINATKVELFLRRTTASPSDVYVEIRTSPTGTILGTSNIITSTTIGNSALTWIEFRFPVSVLLTAATTYYIRLRSSPSSTDAFSGSSSLINWGYKQTPSSPYAGGEARRYIGRLSNLSDSGQLLDQYDYGFRVYALQ